MLPLYDESAPKIGIPFLTITLILLNVLVLAFSIFYYGLDQAILDYGMIPERILEGKDFSTLLTSLFIHAGFLHLIGNMWFLWLFGDNLEHNLGPLRFFLFYFLTGTAASLAHIFSASAEELIFPVVGASGAISGVLGGYVALFPANKIKAFMIGYFRPYVFSVPAWTYAFIWFLYQLLYAGTPSSVAYMAHIGGFISGIILALILGKRKEKRLL